MSDARPSRDEYFSRMAELVATRSTCIRRSVGCVLVSARGHVLATGYNGVAAGLAHCNALERVRDPFDSTGEGFVDHYPNLCPGALRADGKRWPSGKKLDGCEAIHAEQNALLQCHDVFVIETCYVTVSPCITCVKLLLGTSCQRIVFIEAYSHDDEAKRIWLSRKSNSWNSHKGDA